MRLSGKSFLPLPAFIIAAGFFASALSAQEMSFTDDYNNPGKNKTSFTSDDNIYARVKFSGPPTKLLPKADHNIQYYRLVLKADGGNYNRRKNSVRLPDNRMFKIAYNKAEFLVPIVPQKEFYDHLRKAHKNKAEGNASAVARNYPRQIPYMLQNLKEGDHTIKISFEIVAKGRGSRFKKIGVKGSFRLKMKSSGRSRYSAIVPTIRKWYFANKKLYDRDSGAAFAGRERKRREAAMKNMTPEERSCYQRALKSSIGYLVCYQGPTKRITFRLKKRRKSAYLSISWPNYRGRKNIKFRGGNASVMVTRHSPKTVAVPIGARVATRKKTLIRRVTRRTSRVKYIYWYH